MAVSIDGPPQADVPLQKASDTVGSDNAEERPDPSMPSIAARGFSFAFRSQRMTQHSTAQGSFWSSMFRTTKTGKSLLLSILSCNVCAQTSLQKLPTIIELEG